MAYTMSCIVTNRQPARHMFFTKRIAVHLSVFQEMCYLTQGITEVPGLELRKHLFTHFRYLQTTPFPIRIMVTYLTNARNVEWSNLIHALFDVKRTALVQTLHGVIPTQVGL
jgi:hypothetical protein